jgi:preprotein translocase subunit SecD
MRRIALISLGILLVAIGIVPLLRTMRLATRASPTTTLPAPTPEYSKTGGYILDLAVDASEDRDAIARAVLILQRRLDPDRTLGIEIVSDEKAIEVRVPVPGGLSSQAKDWLTRFAALGSSGLWDQARQVSRLAGTPSVPTSELDQAAIEEVAAGAGEHGGAIREFAKACAAVEATGEVGDPIAVVELVCRQGTLEVRIGAAPGETPKPVEVVWAPLHRPEDWASPWGAETGLQQFRSDPAAYLEKRGMIAVVREGRVFVQLGNTPANSLTSAQPGWAVESVQKAHDQIGRPSISYRLDAAGGGMMEKMTPGNVERQIAIIADGEVYTMPRLKTAIGGMGIIEGRLDPRELAVLTRTLSIPMPPRVRVVGAGQ